MLQCFANDPVQLAKLTVFVNEKLATAQANCGGSTAFKTRYLESTDPALLKQIQRELAN